MTLTATTIAAQTADLTGFARARAFTDLGAQVAAEIATGTLDTTALLAAVDLHTWLHAQAAHAARTA